MRNVEQRLTRVETDIMELKARLNTVENATKIADTDRAEIKIRIAVAENNIQDMKDDLSDIKGQNTWIFRTVMGTLITVILTALITWGGFGQ